MICYNLSETVSIFYKADSLATNQNITFDIWDDSGTVVFSSLEAIEIGDEGV